MFDVFKSDRAEKRVRGAFEYYIRMACDQKRNSRSLRRAMKYFEDKDRISGPLADLGIPTRDWSDFLPPPQRPVAAETKAERGPAPERRGQGPFKHSSPPAQGSRGAGPSSASQSTPRPSKGQSRSDDDRPATPKDFVNLLREALVGDPKPSAPPASTPTPPNPNIQ